MDASLDKAENANRAATEIGRVLMQTLDELRANLEVAYDLDGQLVMLAIAKASVGIAIGATAEIADMEDNECDELEVRLYEVIFDALGELQPAEKNAGER